MNDLDHDSAVEVIFRIFGDSLDVDEMTKALDIRPSASHQKGDDISKAKGVIVNARTGSWTLAYGDCYRYGGIEERINYILEILSCSRLDFRKVPGYERAIINCIVSTGDESVECQLTPKVMKQLSDFEIAFELTVL